MLFAIQNYAKEKCISGKVYKHGAVSSVTRLPGHECVGVMLCMYTLFCKRCTLYKFIEINYVLFCSLITHLHTHTHKKKSFGVKGKGMVSWVCGNLTKIN